MFFECIVSDKRNNDVAPERTSPIGRNAKRTGSLLVSESKLHSLDIKAFISSLSCCTNFFSLLSKIQKKPIPFQATKTRSLLYEKERMAAQTSTGRHAAQLYTEEKAVHLIRVFAAVVSSMLLVGWMQLIVLNPLKEEHAEMVRGWNN